MKEVMHHTVAMPTLLIAEEIGYLPFGREQANLFFQVVGATIREGIDDPDLELGIRQLG